MLFLNVHPGTLNVTISGAPLTKVLRSTGPFQDYYALMSYWMRTNKWHMPLSVDTPDILLELLDAYRRIVQTDITVTMSTTKIYRAGKCHHIIISDTIHFFLCWDKCELLSLLRANRFLCSSSAGRA